MDCGVDHLSNCICLYTGIYVMGENLLAAMCKPPHV